MEIALLAFLFLIWAASCVAATRAVVRDDLSDRHQKSMQIALAWLVPVIGPLIVLAVHRKPDPPSGKYYAPADPGDDFARSGQKLDLPTTPDTNGSDQA
jgi:hypothetical protein